MSSNNSQTYLTVQEVMAILGISRPTVYKMIREGKLKAINTGKKYIFPPDAMIIKKTSTHE